MSKKMTGGLLKNKGVLYMFLILALIDVYALLYQKDIKTLMIFVLASFITSYYSKNMTIILIIGLVVSNVFKSLTYIEGFQVDFQGVANVDSADHTLDLGGRPQEALEEAFQNEGDDDDEDADVDDADVEEDSDDGPAISQEQVNDAKELAKTQKALLKNLKDMQPLLEQAEGFANKYGNKFNDEKISKLIKALDAKQK